MKKTTDVVRGRKRVRRSRTLFCCTARSILKSGAGKTSGEVSFLFDLSFDQAELTFEQFSLRFEVDLVELIIVNPVNFRVAAF